jgi:DNA segregation ATPase FtsK/SpoIIIE, S-DNA-T family
MEERYDLIKGRQGIAPGTPDELITSDIWGLPDDERPAPIVLFIDEVAELFLIDAGRTTELSEPDELGDHLVPPFLLLPGGDGAQLTGRVCHRVNDEASAKMALGDIAPEAVYAACAIAPELPGLAVVGDTSGGWSRIRTPHLTLAEAAATCRETAHLAPDVPALAPFRPYVPPAPVEVSGPPVATPRPVAE